MDTIMLHLMRQTSRTINRIAGAAASGCGGFFMRSNGGQLLACFGAVLGGGRARAALSGGFQGVGVYTQAPQFAVIDGIGVPRRRKRRS